MTIPASGMATITTTAIITAIMARTAARTSIPGIASGAGAAA